MGLSQTQLSSAFFERLEARLPRSVELSLADHVSTFDARQIAAAELNDLKDCMGQVIFL